MHISKVISFFVHPKQEYDSFRRPPDFTIAQQHGISSRFAIVQEEKHEICPCCGFPIINEQLPLCCDKQDMSFNGAGVPLFYEFLNFSMIIMVILGLLSGIYNTISNKLGNECQQSNICLDNYFNIFSLSNTAGEEDVVLYVLDLLSTLAIIGATVYYRRWMNLTTAEIDNANISISDYSIQASNLPFDATEQEIIEFFSEIDKNGRRIKLDVSKVCMGYNLQEYNSLVQLKLQKELQLTTLLTTNKTLEQKLQNESKATLESELKDIQKELSKFENNFETTCTFSGVAFITYNVSQHSKLARQYYNLSKVQLMFQRLLRCCKQIPIRQFRNKIPLVVRAPEPGDILWQNLGVDPWLQFKFQVLTNIATILILAVCFGAILGISVGQDEISNSSNNFSTSVSTLITILGLIASLVISVLNAFMSFATRKLVNIEKHATQTEFNISYAYKLGISQFINTAIIPLLVNVALTNDSLIDRIWNRGGLNQDIGLILIINAIFPWAYDMFDPFYIWKMYKRNRAQSEGKNCNLTQREANILFEGQTGDLSEKYATVVKTIMLTFFYAQLLPLGIYMALGFFIIYYWMEKIILLRRNSRGPSIGAQLAQEMVDMYIELALVLFAAGNCIWQKILVGEIHILVWIQLGIAGAQFLLPIDWIFEWFLAIDEANTIMTYEQSRFNIWDDYSKRNPATMQKSIEEWMKNNKGNPEQQQKMEELLERIRLQNEDKMHNAQHKIMQKLIPTLHLRQGVRGTQVVPQLNENLLIRQNDQIHKQEIKLTQSIMREDPDTVKDYQPPKNIRQADSFTYD